MTDSKTYQVFIYGDTPPAIGEDFEGGLTAIHPENTTEYDMPLRTAKALVRKVEKMGMFAAVVDPDECTVIWNNSEQV